MELCFEATFFHFSFSCILSLPKDGLDTSVGRPLVLITSGSVGQAEAANEKGEGKALGS